MTGLDRKASEEAMLDRREMLKRVGAGLALGATASDSMGWRILRSLPKPILPGLTCRQKYYSITGICSVTASENRSKRGCSRFTVTQLRLGLLNL